MEIDNTNTTAYTTSVMPSFTFIIDGPNTSKHNQDIKLSSSHSNTNSNNTKIMTSQMSATKTVPEGPLHIIPSWQPIDPKDKPPYSYATLIAHAILSSEQRRLTLSEIYKWITIHYPYYTMQEHGWQNSIRHNLSLNKGFIRIQRSSIQNNNININSNNNHNHNNHTNNTGSRGNYWTIRTGYEQTFIDNLIKRRGPINKQPVSLPRSLQQQQYQRRRSSVSSYRSSTNNTYNDDNESISSYPTSGNNSPLFATFRMMMPTSANHHHSPESPSSSTSTLQQRFTKRKRSMPELHHHYNHHSIQQRRRSTVTINKIKEEVLDEKELDSDCDSGIDVGQDFLSFLKKNNEKIKKSNSIANFNDPLSTSTTTFMESSTSTPLLYQQYSDNNYNYNYNNNDKIVHSTLSTPLLQHNIDNESISYDNMMMPTTTALASTPSFNWNNDYNNNHGMISSNMDITNQLSTSPTLHGTSSSNLFFADQLHNSNAQLNEYLFQDHDLLNDWII